MIDPNNVPDNYDIWKRHDAEQQKQLAQLPVCCYCDEHITDEHAYYINGEWYCEDCMEMHFRKEVLPE